MSQFPIHLETLHPVVSLGDGVPSFVLTFTFISHAVPNGVTALRHPIRLLQHIDAVAIKKFNGPTIDTQTLLDSPMNLMPTCCQKHLLSHNLIYFFSMLPSVPASRGKMADVSKCHGG